MLSFVGVKKMKDSAKYAKIVEWSEEDRCYVGSAPGLIYGGCHGDDEQRVFEELCQIVEEAIELYRKEGSPFPPATSGCDLANRMQSVA
jgi:predicted RNase H-like HicB family nuclease